MNSHILNVFSSFIQFNAPTFILTLKLHFAELFSHRLINEITRWWRIFLLRNKYNFFIRFSQMFFCLWVVFALLLVKAFLGSIIIRLSTHQIHIHMYRRQKWWSNFRQFWPFLCVGGRSLPKVKLSIPHYMIDGRFKELFLPSILVV